jgi:site-specific DNA-methyltransferase (adenine-specific)
LDENTIKLFGSKNTDDWATPRYLYNQLDAEFHFDLDPCPLEPKEDGLSIEWNGNIFVNPPYSKVKEFLQKAHIELKSGRAKTVVFLVFVNTDTTWFHDYIYNKAEIRFIKGRVKFVGPSKAGSMRPSMIVIFKGESV